MRWEGGRRSDNVEDYRGGGGNRFGGGGLKLGIGGTLLALVAAYFFGVDPRVLLGLAQSGGADSGYEQEQPPQTGAPSDQVGQFVAVVLADTEDTWGAIFQASGRQYVPPKLDLFTSEIRTGCGYADSRVGPFYCPADSKVYLDPDFFNELRTRFQAPGEFAEAYVIAHEVGHHVQNLLGTESKVRAAQERASEVERNQLQVRMELQADCFAGVWAHNADRARHIIEQGDVEAALNAASAVGDDTIQRRTQGHVVPDSFTHGTAKQRMTWFQRGLDSGSVGSCDTFSR
jgi:uncharacterized protein